MSFRLTVPGNLLLAGEYALLEEGGLGAAIAVEPRLTVTVFPGKDWELVGRWPGAEERWTPEETPTFSGSVFLAALDALSSREDERGRRFDRQIPSARIEIDSSAFFDPQGRKRGFGSSAALAVGVACALARLQGREHEHSIHQTAVLAHRRAQGGVGSGYDVTASFFGGFGLFVGGHEPRWEPLNPHVLPRMAVFSGPQAVKTVRSIDLYHAWKTAQSQAAGAFVEQSNHAVRALVRAARWSDLRAAWSVCRDVGLQVGDAVGSSARLTTEGFPASSDEGAFYKALGAGNETGLAAGPREAFGAELPPGWSELSLSSEGVIWE